MSLTMTAERIAQTVAEYFAASRSPQLAEGMTACFAEDAISYDPIDGPPNVGKAGINQFFVNISALFAEVGLHEDYVFITGQTAIVKWTGRGVGHNGKAVTFEGIDYIELTAEGLIQTLKGYWDAAPVIGALTS